MEAALEAPVWPGDQGGLPREGPLRLRGKWEVAEVDGERTEECFMISWQVGSMCGEKSSQERQVGMEVPRASSQK